MVNGQLFNNLYFHPIAHLLLARDNELVASRESSTDLCTLSRLTDDGNLTFYGLSIVDYPDESLVITVELYQIGGDKHTHCSLHIVGERLTNHARQQLTVTILYGSLHLVGP